MVQIHTLDELQPLISYTVSNIPQRMLYSVLERILLKTISCLQHNGGHFQHFIWGDQLYASCHIFL